jgi:hypothetical protein
VAVKKGLPRTVTEAEDREGYTVPWEDKKDDPEF